MKKTTITIIILIALVGQVYAQDLCDGIDPLTLTMTSMSQPIIDCMISKDMQISNEQFPIASEKWQEYYVLGEYVNFEDEKQREIFIKTTKKEEFNFEANIKNIAKYYVYLYDEEKETSEDLWKEDDYKIFEKMSTKVPALINIKIQNVLQGYENHELKFLFIFYAEKKEEVNFTDIIGSFANYEEDKKLFNTSGERWTEFTLKELKLYEGLGYSGFYVEQNGKLSAEKFMDEKICEECDVTVTMNGVHVSGKDVKLPNGAFMNFGSVTIYNNNDLRFYGESSFRDKNLVQFKTSGTTDYLYGKSCTSSNVYSCIEYFESPTGNYYGFDIKTNSLQVYDYGASIDYMNIEIIQGNAVLSVFGPDNSAIFATKDQFKMRGEMIGMIRFEQIINSEQCVGFYNSYSYKCGPNVFEETSLGNIIENKAQNMEDTYEVFSYENEVGENYPEGISDFNKVIAGQELPGTFSCNDIITYAQKYIGTGYGGTGPCSAERATKRLCTTQCGSFVTNVFTYSASPQVGNKLRGNGKDKCEAQGIGLKFLEADTLQPGDIFASTSPTSKQGHTGIYVGKGRVENLFRGENSCYKDFIPDSVGEHVFIHSMGPVCYSTLSDLTDKQKRSIISYCRVDGC